MSFHVALAKDFVLASIGHTPTRTDIIGAIIVTAAVAISCLLCLAGGWAVDHFKDRKIKR